MKAIDRVMRAYKSVRKMTDEEAARVQAELSDFIEQLMLGNVTRKPPTYQLNQSVRCSPKRVRLYLNRNLTRIETWAARLLAKRSRVRGL